VIERMVPMKLETGSLVTFVPENAYTNSDFSMLFCN